MHVSTLIGRLPAPLSCLPCIHAGTGELHYRGTLYVWILPSLNIEVEDPQPFQSWRTLPLPLISPFLPLFSSPSDPSQFLSLSVSCLFSDSFFPVRVPSLCSSQVLLLACAAFCQPLRLSDLQRTSHSFSPFFLSLALCYRTAPFVLFLQYDCYENLPQ